MIESDTLAIEAYIRACCSWFELVTQWYLKALKLAILYTLLYKALYNIFAQHMVFICTYKSFTTSCSL